MAFPWMRVIDTVIRMRDLARVVRGPSRAEQMRDETGLQIGADAAPGGPLEVRLAGVVVAALKEAFDRDHRRLEFEREHMEAERQRAERALRLELIRQAGEREIGRLRLIAGVAAASWLGTLFFAARLIGASPPARVSLGIGWLLLLAALATAFSAQSSAARTLARVTDSAGAAPLDISSGLTGALAPWLIIAGLGTIAIGILL
jgi:hypothetical protein